MLMINHMSAGYGDSNVIKDLNLEVADGKIVCLIGRNGVGKSTTLKGIMGLIKTPSGSAMLENQEMIKMPTYDRVKLGIGYVPQGREIFPQMTVQENLELGLKARAAERYRNIYMIFSRFCQPLHGVTAATCPVDSSSSWQLHVRWSRNPKF